MISFRKSKLEERYQYDPAFNQLVKSLEGMIHQHGFTPTELRQATFLAHYKYEMENPHAIRHRVEIEMAEFWRVPNDQPK